MNADVGDATPLEDDEKLPKMMGLKLLCVQEPSLEQEAVNDVLLCHQRKGLSTLTTPETACS